MQVHNSNARQRRKLGGIGKDTVKALVLVAVNDMIFRVISDAGQHVGNLKKIRGVWKFKAIGYDSNGLVIPGGGPLTDRHNTVFDQSGPESPYLATSGVSV